MQQNAGRFLADRIHRMPDIEAYGSRTRNDVCGSRLDAEAPYGRDQTRDLSSAAFNAANPFGRAGQRVAPEVHGGGSRMICLTGEREGNTALSGDRLDDPEP